CHGDLGELAGVHRRHRSRRHRDADRRRQDWLAGRSERRHQPAQARRQADGELRRSLRRVEVDDGDARGESASGNRGRRIDHARATHLPRRVAQITRELSWCRMPSGRPTRRNRMNVRHLVPSVSRRLLAMGSLMLAAGLQQPVHASGVDLSKFRRIEPQYIAALGDPGATSGSGAQSWGLWSQDPGPRGCKLDRYDQLKAAGGVAPSQWKFDAADWWLEEHGLIMEKP